MTKEELIKELRALQEEWEKFAAEIESKANKLKKEFIEENSPYQIGEVWIRNSDKERCFVYKVEIDDNCLSDNSSIVYLIYFKNNNKYYIGWTSSKDIGQFYVKEDENVKTEDEILHEKSVDFANYFTEMNQRCGAIQGFEAGYKQALRDLKNKQ